jgi:photosystem II oxygen-evolving enhancer protein 1
LVQSAQALSYDDIQGQTYMQVKGSGRANLCPTLDNGQDASALKPGKYRVERFCMEPTKITVKEESQFKGGATEFVPTKLVTRLTYTLDQVPSKSASIAVDVVQMCAQRCPSLETMCISFTI